MKIIEFENEESNFTKDGKYHPLHFLDYSYANFAYAKVGRTYYYLVRSRYFNEFRVYQINKINQYQHVDNYRLYDLDDVPGAFLAFSAYLEHEVVEYSKVKTCRASIKVRDFQRTKVYRWEDRFCAEFKLQERVPYHEQQRYVNKIVSELGKKPVVVKKTTCGVSTARSGNLIKMNTESKWILLHELAHIFDQQTGSHDSHGPKFVKTMIELQSKYFNIPKENMINHAKIYGVKVA